MDIADRLHIASILGFMCWRCNTRLAPGGQNVLPTFNSNEQVVERTTALYGSVFFNGDPLPDAADCMVL